MGARLSWFYVNECFCLIISEQFCYIFTLNKLSLLRSILIVVWVEFYPDCYRNSMVMLNNGLCLIFIAVCISMCWFSKIKFGLHRLSCLWVVFWLLIFSRNVEAVLIVCSWYSMLSILIKIRLFIEFSFKSDWLLVKWI